jgi:MFS family permease
MKAAEGAPPAAPDSGLAPDGPRRRHTALALLTGAQMVASFGTIGLPSLAPLVRQDLDLSLTQAGSLLSAFYFGRFIVALPAGWLTDRFGARATWLAGQVVAGVFLLAASRVGTYLWLLAALAGVGLGFGGSNPASQRAVMDWFPPDSRATAVGIRQTGAPLGGALGGLILPAIALTYGWHAGVATAGLAVCAMFVLSALAFRMPRRSALGTDDGPAPAGPSVPAVGRTGRSVIPLLAGATALFSCVQMSYTGYLTLYLNGALGYSVKAAGALLAQANIGGIAGTILLGLASDRLFGGRRKPVLIGCAAAVAWLLAGQTQGARLPGWMLVALLFAIGALAIGWDGVHFAMVAELAPRGRTGLALGVGHLGSTAGAVLGPILFGKVLGWTDSFAAAWLFAGGLAAANAAALGWLPEPRRKG